MRKNTYLHTHILYAGFSRAEKEWKYKNIVSPFTRLYVFTKGEGVVYMNKNKYILKENDLFIIPKFTSHTYQCNDFTEHLYVCFFDEMIGQQSVFSNKKLRFHLKATPFDRQLMERLVELNYSKKLPVKDPKKYDNRKENLPFNFQNSKDTLAQQLESNGILLQLFSRFLVDINEESLKKQTTSKERIVSIINYINNNLDKQLSVQILANIMCISTDHFSRIFKKIMDITPSQYIQRIRIERAQTLLLTTRFSTQEVAESVGIPNLSQFSTLFLKITHHTPRQYVKLHLKI